MQQPLRLSLSLVCVTILFAACLNDDITHSQSMISSSTADISSVYNSSSNPSSNGIESSSQIYESSSELKGSVASSVTEPSSSENQSFSSSSVDPYLIETGVFTDERDGYEYRWTKINGQTWLGGNLNYATDEGSTCFNDSLHNCETFGRLYTWGAAMKGGSGSNSIPSGVQGICPNTWHIPSEGEWNILVAFIDDIPNGGAWLKTTDLWVSYPGTNEFEFYANPAGNRHLDGRFAGENYAVNWWTSKEDTWMDSDGESGYDALIYGLSDQDNDFSWGPSEPDLMYSVRCIKDE